jgi:Flp pilus assembly CpaF family ATPase
MQIRYHNIHENRTYVAAVTGGEVRIGRHAECDITLQSPYLSDDAARLYRHETGWRLDVLNSQGARLGSAVIDRGRTIVLPPDGSFELFPWRFTLDPENQAEVSADAAEKGLEDRTLHLIQTMHRRLLEQLDTVEEQSRQMNQDELLRLERNLEIIGEGLNLSGLENRDLVRYLAGQCVRGELTDEVLRHSKHAELAQELLKRHSEWSELQSAVGSFESVLQRLMRQVTIALELPPSQQISERLKQIDRGFRSVWRRISGEVLEEQLLYLCHRQLKKQIKDIVFGYGPLEDLLRLPAISEIMVVGCDRIFVERDGLIENSGRRFLSDDVTERIIDRIVSQVGRRINQSEPIVDARLHDGSRVNAVIAPVALDGPLLTIRRFSARPLTTNDLIASGSLTESAAAFLQACVENGCNILVSGGTGTGKTTMLNCLSSFIPADERIVTIEDTAELQLSSTHVARMETRSANEQGAGGLSICDLVRNALRMRPDRIIVGECRGAEALWMLQAMNTGHDGSLTTIHANSAAEVAQRLEVMVQSAATLPAESVFRQITGAIDLVVHLEKVRDGDSDKRVVREIAEVLPSPDGEAGADIRQLFVRDVRGQLNPTGRLPTFLGQLMECAQFDIARMYPTQRVAAGANGATRGIESEMVS